MANLSEKETGKFCFQIRHEIIGFIFGVKGTGNKIRF